MKSILSNFSKRLKVTRKPTVAPCDCSDFFKAVESAPSVEALRCFVESSRFNTNVIGSTASKKDYKQGIHSLAFDLQYRCGGAGRCMCAASPSCRFPTCFAMRPVTKGAEIQSERYAFEAKKAVNPAVDVLIQFAQEEQLEKAVEGIKHLVDSNIRKSAGGRKLSMVLGTESETLEGFIAGAAKIGSASSYCGINPLDDDVELREEVISLYLWRAALLVNLRRDAVAVSSLLNLASALKQHHRTHIYEAATKWAVFNDMEIIYYRALLGKYKAFPQAELFARGRPLLLQRVFDCVHSDDFHAQHCASIVISKQVITTVSGAQASQAYGDLTEDPMKSLCIPLAIVYYRFKVGKLFWRNFFNSLCMPPLPPLDSEQSKGQATEPTAKFRFTPSHILDAVGRSMLLHHLIIYADMREKEIDKGVIVTRVKRLKALGKEVEISDYDHVLNAKDMEIAIACLRQLLVVAHSLRESRNDELSQRYVLGNLDLSDESKESKTIPSTVDVSLSRSSNDASPT